MAVDKTLANAYIWYSGATNVTGEKLAEALGMKHGRKKPVQARTSLVLGWGAKTKESVALGTLPTLNHPDKIRVNRNKLGALELMKKAKVNVAPFCTDMSTAAMKKAGVSLPAIGRTKYHQGGKGFWNCPTMSHVTEAQGAGASYFQNLIEIKDEFRLHIVGDKCIYAVKKAKRTVEEMEAAYIKHEMDRQMALSEKNDDKLDKKTMEVFLKRQAKKFAQDGANMLIRSNRLGWKFVRVKAPDKSMVTEAVKACKAIGLDFGAVDSCIDVSGKPWIIEVNTGPGLEETPFDAWVEALRKMITGILEPKSVGRKIIDKVTGGSGPNKAPAVAKAAAVGGSKSKLADKLALAQDMVAAADEEEAAVLDKVFGKMFGK